MAQTVSFQYLGSGGRLDRILTDQLGEMTRSRIQKLIKDGRAAVNNQTITKTGHKLEGGESISLEIPDPAPVDIEPENIPLDILYEDSNILVLNKSAGMVVHPSVGHDSGTLVHAILHHLPDLEGIGGERRPGIVHRLDRNTSGVLLVAKNDYALQHLQRQFKDRKVKKKYRALTDGHPPTPEGIIEMPVGRDPSHRKRMAVTPESRGKMAVTVYRTIEKFDRHSFLDIDLKTGRTHQIRVHLSYIGSPVAGDTVYGFKKRTIPLKQRFFLHAYTLRIVPPGKDNEVTFTAPMPPGLENVLTWLLERDK